MKVIIIIVMTCTLFLFNACETTQTTSKVRIKKSLLARITYYTKHEDRFGSRVACSKHMRAKQGETIAAHTDFPFWQKIFIPNLKDKVGNGHFLVQDRGTAVNRRKAVPKNWRDWMYTFDVFLDMSNRSMRRFASTQPPYMPVYVEE